MAFPVAASFAHTGAQPLGTSSVAANAASGIAAGNALLVFATASTGGTRAALDSANTGWTPIGTAVAAGGSRRSWAYGRMADGSSDTFTLNRSDAACTMSASMIRFTGHFAGTVAQVFDISVAGDNGAFSGINFGAKTPSWGAQDTLWVGGLSLTTSDQTDPAGYTQLFSTDIDGGFIGWRNEAWFRNLNAASEDPPNFGSGADLVTGFFVGVRPEQPAGAFGTGAALGALVAGGTLASVASAFAAGAILGPVSAGGALSIAPGVVTVPELRNWSGALLTSQLVENVVVIRISDRAVLASFTNQTTNGTTGNLSVSQVGLVPGTACLVVGFSADGSAAFTRAVTIA
jgi:hypothetical protein